MLARCGTRGALTCCWHDCDMVRPLWETAWCSHHTIHTHSPGYLPKGAELYVHTTTCTRCLQQLFRNCQNLVWQAMSLSRQVDKNSGKPDNWVTLSSEKKWPTKTWKTWWRWKCILPSESSPSDKAPYCGIATMGRLDKASMNDWGVWGALKLRDGVCGPCDVGTWDFSCQGALFLGDQALLIEESRPVLPVKGVQNKGLTPQSPEKKRSLFKHLKWFR